MLNRAASCATTALNVSYASYQTAPASSVTKCARGGDGRGRTTAEYVRRRTSAGNCPQDRAATGQLDESTLNMTQIREIPNDRPVHSRRYKRMAESVSLDVGLYGRVTYAEHQPAAADSMPDVSARRLHA